ncbi:osmoprotectant ABC transporter substrate-binding protein [Staphylococcus gallinarum]|jgi:osmoprotectant transport system substrate-binding protein|uniref:osmoprotectant ABC transporter substrate-binding protein n=1 Tax=Staphylococcus gallinarum TaxID=1293 RepID=UPI000D1DDE22|nr:osmoprotectant ABC transporter substrate-binding protein [Staphylococcus gallinarum]MCD8819844.1 osmoprotectant ABC transporter substrate-binding protein [Staphylococcus gallinarum]MCQ9287339.1 osmoprotectant ABC transporter substrate-binding protein [Staphylococcus gallinarum]PTL07051.1 osmoprotectant ABC transporter substrate-binding protein [Staphylococcus gallinarum]PTL10172.1 osmoprotectant ABC transporter substrate-binding protein [Staphylococcus gallinarum]RIL30766.1 osmoprotectant A
MNFIKHILLLCIGSLIFVSGCDLPGLGGSQTNKSVKISALATSESQIMAYMLKDLIEHDTKGKIQGSIINNLGSATIQHNALLKGDADISSTRYTGTDLTGVLKQKPITDSKKAMHITQNGFNKKFDQTFFNSYGFENTFAFMVTKETAQKYHLHKVSDLEKVKNQVKVGTDTTWIKRGGDGYEPFKVHYGFGFNNLKPMQIGLVYDALKNKKLDVALGYTTDGRIAAYDLVVLKDDKNFFPPYDASAVAPNKLLSKHPEIKRSINKLDNKINTKEMQKLNYEADGEGKEPAIVAQDFLKKHNYFDKK